MATPFKGMISVPKDAHKCFQSQLCIDIECAFGILVHRWGCLHKPLPVNFRFSKITALVRCLCMLYNFCINENQFFSDIHSAADESCIVAGGGSFPQ